MAQKTDYFDDDFEDDIIEEIDDSNNKTIDFDSNDNLNNQDNKVVQCTILYVPNLLLEGQQQQGYFIR